MTEERVTPLRQRMMEDMRIRGMGDKAQKAHIRAIKDFAAFLGRPPDTATPENLRAYQLHMSGTGVTPSTFNARIVALRFFFGMTCGREEMKRYMQFRTQPRKPPVVFSVGEVSDILMAAPGPGLKYRAALSISYGAGLRAAEVCNLKIGDIVPEARLRHDSDRMLIQRRYPELHLSVGHDPQLMTPGRSRRRKAARASTCGGFPLRSCIRRLISGDPAVHSGKRRTSRPAATSSTQT